MARPKRTKQLQDIIDDVNPLTVVTVVDDYGIGAARECWHWCAHYVGEIAAEVRRMKAAGEKWTRAARPSEPEDMAPAPKPVPWKPTFVPSSPAPAAKIPVPVPEVPTPDRHAELHARIEGLQETVRGLRARLARLEAEPVPPPSPAPVPAPIRSFVVNGEPFPMEPGRLLKKARTTTIPTLAMMLGTTGRRVRDAIEEARRIA